MLGIGVFFFVVVVVVVVVRFVLIDLGVSCSHPQIARPSPEYKSFFGRVDLPDF